MPKQKTARVFNIASTLTADEDDALRKACLQYKVSISTAVRHLIASTTGDFQDFSGLEAVRGERSNVIDLEERRRRYAAEGYKPEDN